MHEMSLAKSMYEIIEETARKNNAKQVKSVQVELGVLSHAEPDALTFAFEVVTHGTIAEGARFDIIRLSGKAWCMVCARTVPLPKLGAPCPDCNGYQLAVTQGDEMRIASIEII
ncbi:MAG: hydrogenase maturation nickel metallochaperone HypA [Burkholderiales bacterium]|jgi:hydrogenase nickel incorporation protein HypA/HybF|nr:hydrogenase maturation nickel metallochaperone HypA [Burkholderiales bacterium]